MGPSQRGLVTAWWKHLHTNYVCHRSVTWRQWKTIHTPLLYPPASNPEVTLAVAARSITALKPDPSPHPAHIHSEACQWPQLFLLADKAQEVLEWGFSGSDTRTDRQRRHIISCCCCCCNSELCAPSCFAQVSHIVRLYCLYLFLHNESASWLVLGIHSPHIFMCTFLWFFLFFNVV